MAQGSAKTASVTKTDYLSLATFVAGKDNSRLLSKERHSEILRTSAEMFEDREYVAAYECLKPVYDKVVSNMQRVLARNVDFEANKLAKELRKPVSVAKENVLGMKAHAQQVIDQFDRILKDLESKPLVRHHLKKGRPAVAAAEPDTEEAPPTTLSSTSETHVDVIITAPAPSPAEPAGEQPRYRKAPYVSPEKGTIYEVRDKSGKDRVIRVTSMSPDGLLVQVETLQDGQPSKRPIELAADSLARQAAKGLCSVLIPIDGEERSTIARSPDESDGAANPLMRIDSQNFGRCCGDIARADIKFSTQLIKDVGDGPFRAGKYEQAFLTFEQLAIGFNAAVAASRRTIADGRRELTAEKGNLSGKEIQERTAAFMRSEQLIHTAEREFSTILEGLRMYLRSEQG
jgi:hypothetical protein